MTDDLCPHDLAERETACADGMCPLCLSAALSAARQREDALRKGLEAAIRAADLALFVIEKQGVMPNSSWQGGFERDLKLARECLAAQVKL